MTKLVIISDSFEPNTRDALQRQLKRDLGFNESDDLKLIPPSADDYLGDSKVVVWYHLAAKPSDLKLKRPTTTAIINIFRLWDRPDKQSSQRSAIQNFVKVLVVAGQIASARRVEISVVDGRTSKTTTVISLKKPDETVVRSEATALQADIAELTFEDDGSNLVLIDSSIAPDLESITTGAWALIGELIHQRSDAGRPHGASLVGPTTWDPLGRPFSKQDTTRVPRRR